MEKNLIIPYFEEVETTREYNGYFYSVPEVITIVIPGSICGLQNISQIHQWAQSMLPEKMDRMTIAVDGKTIRSTRNGAFHRQMLNLWLKWRTGSLPASI